MNKKYKMSSFEKKFIFFGVFFFLISRCWLLFLGSYALDEPRVGDDSYIYMWKAKSQSLFNVEGYPAIKDIKSQFNLPKDSNAEVNLNRENVGVKVIGTYTPLSDFINGRILLIDSTLKIKWIFIELIVALFLVLSVSLFQITVFGPIPASLSLLSLSVSVFPQHGMSYFMPSVLALSVGMLLWTYIINRKLESNLILVMILSFLTPFIHTVGNAYVLLGIPILGCVIDKKRILSVDFFRLSGAILISLFVSYLIISKYVPSPPQAKTILGFFGIGSFVLENIIHAFWQLSTFCKKSPLIFITFLCSFYWYKKFPKDSLKIFFVFFAITLISMFHFFIYPAELYSRFFVLIGIMMSGFTGVAIRSIVIDDHTLENKKKLLYSFVYFICILLSLILKFYPHSLDTIKWRLGSIDDIALSTQIEELRGKSFLYLEYSNAMQAALLAGAYTNHALVYQMLGDLKGEIISKKTPQIIVAPNYRELNTVGIIKSVPIYPRKLGFSMHFSDYIELTFRNDVAEKNLSLMVDNHENKEIVIKIEINSPTYTNKKFLVIPANYHGWISFSLDHEIKSYEKYKFSFPKDDCWINGVFLGKTKAQVLWPWEFEVTVLNHFRDTSMPGLEIEFSINKLLETYRAIDMLTYISKKGNPIISDNSGLVFIRTIYGE